MNWLRKLFGIKPKLPTFEQWFKQQGFRHFSAREFTSYFEREHNTYPPREMWPNIVPTLRILDNLRSAIGQPIRITSSYRSPEYNERVGGKSKSLHLQFNAIDFQVSGMTPHEVVSILLRWRSQHEFEGGIGLYSTFVHLDTRGYNATW